MYVPGLYDYRTDEMKLPVSELFSLLNINFSRGQDQINIIEGTFLTNGEPYSLNFDNFTATKGGRRFEFNAERMQVGNLDYFMSPEVFSQVFGMEFTVNINALTLSLRSDRMMPIEERRQRELARSRIEDRSFKREFNPLLYDRNRSVLSTGFLDYTVGATSLVNEQRQNYSWSFIGGTEFLGGDLQGTHTGGYTADGDWFSRTSNFRWRYVIRDNPFVSRVEVGQLSTGGLVARRIRGAAVSNEPVESRQLYGSYVVEGTTDPESEVELYFNNRLIDYTVSGPLGYYRFEVPLRYGTTQFQTRIYTPSGEVRVSDRQIQVPFVFIPQGNTQYNIQAGLVDKSFEPGINNSQTIHGDIAYGVTNWMTARVGLDYNEAESTMPSTYGSISARVFGQYLVNVDLVPNIFYRAQTSVIFASARSISLNYVYYDGLSRFNTRQADQQINLNLYTPLPLGALNAGMRVSGDHIIYPRGSETRYSGDLFFRLSEVNLRFNYRDSILSSNGQTSTGTGQVTGSASYTVARRGNVPAPLRGLFLRFSAVYDLALDDLRQIDVQLSRNLFGNGRFSVGASQQLNNNVTIFQAGLNLDLGGRTRSSSDYRGASGRHSVRQSFRGSLGFDDNFMRVQATDRQQVGRSAASVILFVDNNNSGTFDPGDEILPFAAVRLDRSANAKVGGDGVVRLTQLQSYYQYNLEVNRNAIPNPMLVPAVDKFSFIADPNQYKRIEIPFYRSGVIDGSVSLLRDGQVDGQGGIRLFIKGKDNNFNETVRTFYGGGFYAMDIPPGKYTIEVDPSQLAFLGMVHYDGIREFEIRSLADGDFVEDLDILLVPEGQEFVPVTARSLLEEQLFVELKDELRASIRHYVAAQSLVYRGDYRQALREIDTSLRVFENDYAIALKGTILYLLGDRNEAMRWWREANRRNPEISIPNTDLLDLMIETVPERQR